MKQHIIYYFKVILLSSSLLTLVGCTHNKCPTQGQHDSALQTPLTSKPASSSVTDTPGGALKWQIKQMGNVIGHYVNPFQHTAQAVTAVGGVVYQVGDYVTIMVPTDNLFDTYSVELLPNTQPLMNTIADLISRYPEHTLLISGNTSDVGSVRFEQRLSEQRARKMAEYLWAAEVNSRQVSATHTSRLTYIGYGNRFPIASPLKLTGMRLNSRIQITLVPKREKIDTQNYRVFNNIGALNREPAPATVDTSLIDFNKAFPPLSLPRIPS